MLGRGRVFVCLCVCVFVWFSRARLSLEEEIAINETSQCRAVEICVEDHPKMVLSVLTCGMPRESRPTVGRPTGSTVWSISSVAAR